MNSLENQIQRAAEIVAGADALVIAAGAGMGVDSGLPDFRGNDGFWKAYPALCKAQMDFIDVASPRTFEQDPTLAWGFYGHRLNLYRKMQPHAGFGILKRWAESKPLGAWVFTSNVDGQFQRAGFAVEALHECHGSIHHLQCMKPCTTAIWSADAYLPEVDEEKCRLLNAPPVCPHCGGLARPNVLMFGDWGWIEQLTRQQQEQENLWLAGVEQADAKVAIVEVGAGTAVPSVRHFNQALISERGARLVRINVREHQVPGSMDVGLALGALEALTRIDACLKSLQEEGQ